MMDLRNRGAAARLSLGKLVLAVVLIVVILAILYLLRGGNGVVNIASTQNFSLSPSDSIQFSLPDSKNIYVLQVSSSSTSGSAIYVSSVPVLLSRIAAITLTKGQTANLSLGNAPVANAQIRLIGSNATQSVISISFIQRILNVKPSSGVVYLDPGVGASNPTIPALTTVRGNSSTSTAATTAVATAGPSSSTTTVQADYGSIAMAEANATTYGILANNFKALYTKDTACDSNTYNTTFRANVPGSSPTGPNSYASVSPTVITRIYANAKQLSGNVYNVTYTSVSPSLTSSMLVINMNVSTNSIVGTPRFVGLYFGGFNYSRVNGIYTFQSGISGNCGAYIPH